MSGLTQDILTKTGRSFQTTTRCSPWQGGEGGGSHCRKHLSQGAGRVPEIRARWQGEVTDPSCSRLWCRNVRKDTGSEMLGRRRGEYLSGDLCGSVNEHQGLLC